MTSIYITGIQLAGQPAGYLLYWLFTGYSTTYCVLLTTYYLNSLFYIIYYMWCIIYNISHIINNYYRSKPTNNHGVRQEDSGVREEDLAVREEDLAVREEDCWPRWVSGTHEKFREDEIWNLVKLAPIRLILCPQTWFFTADRLERVSEPCGLK